MLRVHLQVISHRFWYQDMIKSFGFHHGGLLFNKFRKGKMIGIYRYSHRVPGIQTSKYLHHFLDGATVSVIDLVTIEEVLGKCPYLVLRRICQPLKGGIP